MNTHIQHIISQLQEIHHGRPWMGPTFKYLLKGVTEEKAFEYVRPGMKTIAEQISHITFWRKEIIHRIIHKKPKMGDDDPQNWSSVKVLRSKGWIQILAEHDQSLDQLIATLENQDDSLLDESYEDKDFKGRQEFRWLLTGIVHHDIYHLGQIGMVKNYLNNKKED